MIHLLLVDDEAILAEPVVALLERQGYRVSWASCLHEARTILDQWPIELVLLDLTLPDGSGLDLLESLPPPPTGPTTLVFTGDHSADTAVAALRRGAHDYVTKPFELSQLLHRLKLAEASHLKSVDSDLRARLERLDQQRRGLVPSTSPAMARVYEMVRKLADSEVPVLVSGETGVGKEHICRMLHDESRRRAEPFVAVNCAELDRQLLRSELFGHERGAFTGATSRHRGLFELTRGGTLMLDEVAEMPSEVQGSFLRVLETGRYRRVGGGVDLESRVRVVAATNKDLARLSEIGAFRRDLFFRLNTVELKIPPLRERPDDVVMLARAFFAREGAQDGLRVEPSDGAWEALRAHPWPGNIRELKNFVQRTALVFGGGRLRAEDLSLDSPSRARTLARVSDGGAFPTLEEVERRHIAEALEHTGGNRTHAARLLGIARSTLVRKLSALDRS